MLTASENVFVLLEDPAAPTKADMQAMAEADPSSPAISPPHFRNTFLTLTPPGALEQLLAQLKAKWVSVRQATAPAAGQKAATTGQQLTIEGHIYAIGRDWLVRAGNVILAGGAVKGMLLEVSRDIVLNARLWCWWLTNTGGVSPTASHAHSDCGRYIGTAVQSITFGFTECSRC